MRKLITVSAAALAVAGMSIGAAAPAEARYHGGGYHGGYHGGYGGYYGHRGGGRTAAYLGVGILGLAAGAAIADSHRGYYGRGYGYGYAPAYYGGPGPAYYNGGYGYYDRGPVCRTDWRWDGYARRYARVQYCD